MACWRDAERTPRLALRTQNKVRLHLGRTGRRRAVRPNICRDWLWRLGAAEMNRVLVARNDAVDWRILPRAQTFEAELVFVIGEGGGKVRGEELRRDLTDHQSSLVQIHAEAQSLVADFARCVVLLHVAPEIVKDANQVAAFPAHRRVEAA
jgi:hypothetical protein